MEGAPLLVDRYELHGAIASGGMATVYLGRMRGAVGFARTVAIKRLHPQLASDPDFVAMFLDEARLVSRVRHPNVIPTIDVVTAGSELLIVMEYAHGESFHRLLRNSRKRQEAVPPGIVATVLTGVLHGLHAAHEATNEVGGPLGIVHRDVTPQNILVGADGEARLLDFGVAKAAGQIHTTREGNLKGKAAYMPPEQVRGKGVDRRTDIYAASVVLWEALAGRRLFDAETDVAIIAQVLETDVPPPSSVGGWVSPELDAVVLRGLARDPDDRYPTARALAMAIEQTMALASQREVAEWVQRVGAEGLARRAAAISNMERAGTPEQSASIRSPLSMPNLLTPPSVSSLARPLAAEHGIPVPPNTSHDSASFSPNGVPLESPVSATGSEVASVMSTPPREGMPAPSRRPVGKLVAFAVGALVLVGTAVFVLRGSGSSTSSDAGAPKPPSRGDTSAATSATTAPVPSPAAATADPSPTPSASALAAAPIASVTPSSTPPKTSKPSSAGKPSCNPPYTTDSAGIMHLKPQCI